MKCVSGILDKLRISYVGPDRPALNSLILHQTNEELSVPLNPHLGKKIKLTFLSEIYCSGCQKQIKKSYGQGYCYPCTQKLAECDLCVVRPELCHFSKGTCRDEKWALQHCFIPHIVYLAATPELKVGITREFQKLTRWHDQGATQAIAVFRMKNRHDSGQVEDFLRGYLNDRTNWKLMLQTEYSNLELTTKRDIVHQVAGELVKNLGGEILFEEPLNLTYPRVTSKVDLKSHTLEDGESIEGQLLGIKGQYLILDNGVFNPRKYTGYKISFTTFDEEISF